MVGIDVYCPWTEAKTVKWNERKAVTPLLTQGCTLQELYLSVLSMVRLVNALYVCLPQLYKKNNNPHLNHICLLTLKIPTNLPAFFQG